MKIVLLSFRFFFFGGVFDFDHDWTWRFRLRFWLQVLDQTSSIPIPPRFLMSFAMKTLSLRLKRRSLRLKVPFHFEPFFHKFCRANALEKSFAWLQTAFAWKVKLVSTTFDWVQNSLFFPSLICQKKQQTRILDHSLKSVILRPQFKGRNFGKTCLTESEVKMCKSVS